MGYTPLHISGNETGLIQSRQEFILPVDAYPVLQNAYVWREQIRRRQGLQLLGRLQRNLTSVSAGTITLVNPSPNFFNIFTSLGLLTTEPNAEVIPGTMSNPITIVIGTQTLTDNAGTGTFSVTAGNITAATIIYATGVITLAFSAPAGPLSVTVTMIYSPGLPVMGLLPRDLTGINAQQTVAFDTKYSYFFTGVWQEFQPGTIWHGDDSDLFWGMNYWVDMFNNKIFWVTNDNVVTAPAPSDPIYYTNAMTGTAWQYFTPVIDASGNMLQQCLAMVPFRGRMIVFNTWEGTTLAGSTNFRQRVRWAAIGNPFDAVNPTGSVFITPGTNTWRDDIRGKGGFLDLPTAENITAIGFVRDNLVIYTEHATWQLRYTGRSIAPFQIEKVNSELGAESTFSAVQFDTSLVGIGDKGVVECDSFKSNRIDIKIPDLVYNFNNTNNNYKRVYGIRDYQQRLAYWTYPYTPDQGISTIYPNRRLVYNYENESWAIFTDSLTCFGTFQQQTNLNWVSFAGDPTGTWENQNYPWIVRPSLFPAIIAGNQQGFVVYLGSNVQPQVTNDITLSITGLTGNNTTPTLVTCPNHNLQTFDVIQIDNIIAGTDFASTLNGNIFSIVINDVNSFYLWILDTDPNSTSYGQFSIPELDPSTNVYVGGGKIQVRDNFIIQSKKFNALDDGQQVQLGYVDILMNTTDAGEISMYVYMNYNNNSPINILPQNQVPSTGQPDEFFNVTIPTTQNSLQGLESTKNWQRIFCPTRAQFFTLVYTLSNLQMVGEAQSSDVQIDSQILWSRNAGRII